MKPGASIFGTNSAQGTKAQRIGKAIAESVKQANKVEPAYRVRCFAATLLGSLDFLSRDCGMVEVKEAREALEKLVFPDGIPPSILEPRK